MRLLLDTHIVIAICRDELERRWPSLADVLGAGHAECFVSVASLWEIAIKTGLGKLDAGLPLERIAEFLEASRIGIIDIDRRCVIAVVEPEPPTRDPFDRLLLAQCETEALDLVTFDRALAAHPLAWQPHRA